MVSAPCDRALAKRSSIQSIQKIRLAPRYFAHMMLNKPTGPAPLHNKFQRTHSMRHHILV